MTHDPQRAADPARSPGETEEPTTQAHPAPPDQTREKPPQDSDNAAAAGGGQSEAERAREVIARALALKKHGGQPHAGPRNDLRGAGGSKRSGFTPPPIRPGGRGRRG
jgi:hypothetical protein